MPDYKIGTFQQGSLTGEQLEVALNNALIEVVAEGSTTDSKAKADTAPLRFSVEEEGGIDPLTILLTIGIAFATGAASEGGKEVFRIVMKKVRDKEGDDALGPERNEE